MWKLLLAISTFVVWSNGKRQKSSYYLIPNSDENIREGARIRNLLNILEQDNFNEDMRVHRQHRFPKFGHFHRHEKYYPSDSSSDGNIDNPQDMLKRLQEEGKIPKFEFPKGLSSPGFPDFPSFSPILTEEQIKKLHPTNPNENVQAHFETYSSDVRYVNGKKVKDEEEGEVIDNDNGKVSEKHYGN